MGLFGDIFGGIGKAVGGIFKSVGKAISGAAKGIFSVAKSIGKGLGGVFGTKWGMIGAIGLAALIPTLAPMLAGTAAAGSPAAAAIAAAGAAPATGTVAATGSITAGVSQTFGGLGATAGGVLPGFEGLAAISPEAITAGAATVKTAATAAGPAATGADVLAKAQALSAAKVGTVAPLEIAAPEAITQSYHSYLLGTDLPVGSGPQLAETLAAAPSLEPGVTAPLQNNLDIALSSVKSEGASGGFAGGRTAAGSAEYAKGSAAADVTKETGLISKKDLAMAGAGALAGLGAGTPSYEMPYMGVGDSPSQYPESVTSEGLGAAGGLANIGLIERMTPALHAGNKQLEEMFRQKASKGWV